MENRNVQYGLRFNALEQEPQIPFTGLTTPQGTVIFGPLMQHLKKKKLMIIELIMFYLDNRKLNL